MQTENGAKERLLVTVIAMLSEGQDPTSVTTRAIAQKAAANPALINYYFGGKQGLLHAAVDHCMAEVFESILESEDPAHPVDRICEMAKAISDVAFASPAIAKIALERDTCQGGTETLALLLPALRQLYAGTKSEHALRLLAAQLVLPMQCMLLNCEEYATFLQVDMRESAARHKLLDEMVHTLLAPPYAPGLGREHT